MQLRKLIPVLSLSLLLSQQVLTQSAALTPSSGSPTSRTSSAPQNSQRRSNCTNNGSYVNSRGQTVKRPENCVAAPQGATAQCRDGTYSFSQSRRGTCSHHGGTKWL